MTLTLTVDQCKSLLKMMRFLSNIPYNDIDTIKDEVILKMVERLTNMKKSEV
jgi:hypothetical protein